VSKRRWYVDVGLILIVVLLGVLIVIRLAKMSRPVEDSEDGVIAALTQVDQTESTEEALVPTEENDPVIVEKANLEIAPDFTLTNLTGEEVSLSDYRGTPVMVNFWATWCPPCRAEMPLIQSYQDKFGDDFVVLAVNGGDTLEQVQSFADANGYTLNFLLDPEISVADLYKVRGFPTSLFIDSAGNLQAVHIGELKAALFDSYLQQIGVSE
jgi:thiol-disulfide isomerase/thioredoxin